MHKGSIRYFAFLATIVAAPQLLCAFQSFHREITRSKEKELVVTVDVSFGSLILEKGEKEKLAIIDYDQDDSDKEKMNVSYDVAGDEGRLKIRIRRSGNIWNDDESDNRIRRKLRIRFSDALPITFNVELGAGTGELDVSGLRVKELRVSTGASSVNLHCSEPNPISADYIEIESGVSKFSGYDLANLNFRELKFSGGVGSYKLDFAGKLRRDAEASVEVGLGSITVSIPRQTAAKIMYDDSWLSNFTVDGDFTKQRSGVYVTENYANDEKRLSLKIESGLGSVRVRQK